MSYSTSRTTGGIATSTNNNAEVSHSESIGKPCAEGTVPHITDLFGNMIGLPDVTSRHGDSEKVNINGHCLS
jgi:hypothetical protein